MNFEMLVWAYIGFAIAWLIAGAIFWFWLKNRISVYKTLLESYRVDLEVLSETYENLLKNKTDVDEKFSIADKERRSLTKSLEKRQLLLIEKENEIQKLSGRTGDYNNKIENLRQEVFRKTEQLDVLHRQNQQKSAQLERFEREIEAGKTLIAQLQLQNNEQKDHPLIVEKNKQIANLHTQLSQLLPLETKTVTLSNQLAELTLQKQDLLDISREKEFQIQILEDQISRLESECEHCKAEVKKLSSNENPQILLLQEKISEKDVQILRLNEKAGEYQAEAVQIQSVIDENARLRNEIEIYIQTISGLKLEVGELEKKLKQTETIKETQSENEVLEETKNTDELANVSSENENKTEDLLEVEVNSEENYVEIQPSDIFDNEEFNEELKIYQKNVGSEENLKEDSEEISAEINNQENNFIEQFNTEEIIQINMAKKSTKKTKKSEKSAVSAEDSIKIEEITENAEVVSESHENKEEKASLKTENENQETSKIETEQVVKDKEEINEEVSADEETEEDIFLGSSDKVMKKFVSVVPKLTPENVLQDEADEEEKSPVFKELSEPKLPLLPRENRAFLQIQSPKRIFLYWALKGNPFKTLRNALGNQAENYQLIVKLIDLKNEAEQLFPIETEGSAWFDVKSNTSYRAEIGFFATNRPFVRLMFSNAIETPRMSPSPNKDLSPNWNITALQFAHALEASGYKQDAVEVAMSGDDFALADELTQKAVGQLIKDVSFEEISGNELRFALIALAAGANLESLKFEISANLYALLQAENPENLTPEKILTILQKHFGVILSKHPEETEEQARQRFSYMVFGASLINFPKSKFIGSSG